MTGGHRPLSPWVSRWPPPGSGPVVVNDGDDRADARDLLRFSSGWRRVAVPIEVGRSALGLEHDDGTTVVELDDFGRPVRASDEDAAGVARIEENWPSVGDDLAELAASDLWLRFWLLERLRAEGEPPDSVFSLLPWDLFDRAIESVLPGLAAGGSVGELVEVRHWLSPAIVGPPGALERLDHGLRTGDARTARAGAAALLSGLRDVPIGRLPAATRSLLVRLVNAIGQADPIFTLLSRLVAAHLGDEPAGAGLSIALDSRLPAAASGQLTRQIETVLGEPPHQVLLVETEAGRLEVTVQLPLPRDEDGPFGPADALIQPVRVRPDGADRVLTWWVALERDDEHLVGEVVFLLPRGLSTLDANEPPIQAAELTGDTFEDLLRSLSDSPAMTAARWRQIAATLPEHHPVRRVVARYETEH